MVSYDHKDCANRQVNPCANKAAWIPPANRMKNYNQVNEPKQP